MSNSRINANWILSSIIVIIEREENAIRNKTDDWNPDGIGCPGESREIIWKNPESRPNHNDLTRNLLSEMTNQLKR